MQYIIGRYKYVLLLIGCWLMVGCSSSSDSVEEGGKSSPLQVAAYIADYQETLLMRAVAAGYSAFNPEYDVTIGLFPIQTSPVTDALPTAKLIRYSSSVWHTQVVVEDNYRYIIYGYMPMKAPITGTVDRTARTMTLTSVPAVMADDLCFVSGVKDGKIGDAGDLLEGSFTYAGKADNNYVCLLMDHLYAALKFNFSINEEYAKLRTIKLKLMTLSSNYQSVTATVSLGTTPAVVTYSPVSGTTTSSATFFEDREGLDIHDPVKVASIKEKMCCFAPMNSQTMTLVSTYDVYDRNGNLIRKDCTSTNTLPTLETLGAVRGDCVTLNMTVNPTYLYQLSDQDLDNLIKIQ